MPRLWEIYDETHDKACGALARARSLWRDLTGESAYDRYLARHRREHPDHEPMSAPEFWRDRSELEETRVSTGCC